MSVVDRLSCRIPGARWELKQGLFLVWEETAIITSGDIHRIDDYLSPSFRTIEWRDGAVILLDQRRLPEDEVYLELRGPEEVAQAIRDMAVRGAPAIGVAAALGMALAAQDIKAEDGPEFLERLRPFGELFVRTRPTAVNLRWALNRLFTRVQDMLGEGPQRIRSAILEEAHLIFIDDVLTNVAIGETGVELVPEQATILTHCNAGALATAGYGTALGVVRSAHRRGLVLNVIADETRPFLQGARLTAWELQKDGIPVTVITDSMAGYFMRRQEISLVIVGADRIAGNGDVANKIGTYNLAVLSRHHQIPFYVAAPLSTFDPSLADGDSIPIEERDPDEVLRWGGAWLAPVGVPARYPAFDITPHHFITGIITERGILKPPFSQQIARLLSSPS